MQLRLIHLSIFSLVFVISSLGSQSTAAGQAATVDGPLASQQWELPAKDAGLAGVGPIRRADWFQNLWREKRTQWSNEVAEKQESLIFFGDSITQGWGDDLGGSFPGVKTANRGISGDTTRGMLIRMDQDVLALNPAGVVMLMGTNDIEMGATPMQISENIAAIIEKIKQHNAKIPIFVCAIFPSSAEKNRPAEKILETNRLVEKSVLGNAQVMWLDTWRLFADENQSAKKSEFPDLLHPNESGYQKWAGALKPAFATYDFLETDDDSFEFEAGFESLFNGNDLTGWCFHRPTDEQLAQRPNWIGQVAWPQGVQQIEFSNKQSSPDQRYVAKHGRIIVTSPPEGRRYQEIWTTRSFPQDFTLRLEFRTTPYADSGVFLRGRQLQCRDYLLAGPYEDLKQYRPGDWNQLEIVVTDNIAVCTCNGEILEEKFELPETGPIGLEGDRGQFEYRRIRIKTVD